jgi:molybdenum cofactor guanylyltransferase
MILGLILAGGLSTRMGGGDKGFRTLGGVPIMTRVLKRIGLQVDRMAINANGDPERFADFELPVIADDLAEYPGPLAGVLAGMDYAAEMTSATHILSVAADCPFLPTDLVIKLGIVMKLREARIAVAHSGGFAQPTIALWDIGLRRDLRNALVDEGLRKIDRFTARYPCASAEWPVMPFDPFFNANTPEDIVEAERILVINPEA